MRVALVTWWLNASQAALEQLNVQERLVLNLYYLEGVNLEGDCTLPKGARVHRQQAAGPTEGTVAKVGQQTAP